jgi:zinc transporter ZupT
MSRRKRTMITLAVVELLLLGGWIWLHGMAMASPNATADSTRAIGEVFGAAMGIVLALAAVLYFLAGRNDRRATLAPIRPTRQLRRVIRS